MFQKFSGGHAPDPLEGSCFTFWSVLHTLQVNPSTYSSIYVSKALTLAHPINRAVSRPWSKVLERIIYDKIIDYNSCQINPAQFGFMQNHSITQQLLLFLSNAFTTHHQLDTVYLDISKAFDTVCHVNLLHKLSTFNISGKLWSWIKDYLTSRSQFVSINNTYSYILPKVSGVPQGSIPGLLLFIMYMNDLPDAIH